MPIRSPAYTLFHVEKNYSGSALFGIDAESKFPDREIKDECRVTPKAEIQLLPYFVPVCLVTSMLLGYAFYQPVQ
jgi:hypothetical protein